MIQTRKDLKFYLTEDFKRNGFSYTLLGFVRRCILEFCGDDSASVLGYLLALRKCEYHFNQKSLWHKIPYYYYKLKRSRKGMKYSIRIPLNVVGYGLRIHHLAGGGGVHLSVKSMGNYCGVNSGVLCGNNKDSYDRLTIGDNVMLNTGCKVFGDISIGDNVVIAAGAIVNKNVPSNCVVGGIPAKIIKAL